MPGVRVKDNESFDSAMRRFKRMIEKCGVLPAMRKQEFFEKPSQMRKRAKAAAIKRFRKKQQRDDARIEPGFASGGNVHQQRERTPT
jgi:small subunit ribosomal protein S21